MPVTRIPLRLPRFDAAAMAYAIARLTPRDYQVLEHLFHHRVLTTHQLRKLFFTNPQPTRRRLGILRSLGMIAPSRPWTPVGSYPNHWVLGPAGAEVLALHLQTTVKELGYDADKAMHPAMSSLRGHHIGVNNFFVTLAHLARHRPGTQLRAWQSERQCAKMWGNRPRPDAYGCWVENGRQIDFFLEHDTGSMTLGKVTDKLAAYADLADTTRVNSPILFWLPSRTRETNLRKLLTTTDLPIATAVQTELGDGPAGPCWLPIPAHAGDRRMRLVDLAGGWPHLTLGKIPDQPDTTENAFLDRIFGEENTER